MITYLGMTMPMAIWSTITWILHPSKQSASEVQIQILKKKQWILLLLSTAIITILFYFLLYYFQTPNLYFSTLSVTTSFLAASLTMLRSSYFAIFYATNDIILIVLWIYATLTDVSYIPVIVNFCIFLFYDCYGFFSWKKREQVQLH